MKLAKQLTKVTALILFCFLVCNSQQTQTRSKANSKTKPDLNGTWVFYVGNEEDIKTIPAYNRKKTDSCLKEIRLKIEHNEPELKFFYTYIFLEEEKTFEEIYYSDERKEKNTDFYYECDNKKITPHVFDNKIETYTYWKGNSLMTRTSPVFNSQSNSELISEFKLSKDGQSLTIGIRIVIDLEGKHRRAGIFFDNVEFIERKFHRVQVAK